MKDTTLTLGELVNHPEVAPFLREDDGEAITSCIKKRDEAPKDPVYIRILSGIGAWFASLFLIGFLGFSRIITNDGGAIITGVILLATAVFLAKKCTSTFPSQLSLAFAFAGNVMVVGGLMELLLHSHSSGHEMLVLLLSHAVVCTTIYILYPSVVYRFAAPLAFVIIATIWASVEVEAFWVMHLLVAGEMLLLGVLLLHTRRTAFIQPLISCDPFLYEPDPGNPVGLAPLEDGSSECHASLQCHARGGCDLPLIPTDRRSTAVPSALAHRGHGGDASFGVLYNAWSSGGRRTSDRRLCVWGSRLDCAGLPLPALLPCGLLLCDECESGSEVRDDCRQWIDPVAGALFDSALFRQGG